MEVERLGLHDYHAVIKSPMDPGTVKEGLAWCHTFTSALLASFEKMYKAAVDWFEEQCKRLEPPKPLCQQNC